LLARTQKSLRLGWKGDRDFIITRYYDEKPERET